MNKAYWTFVRPFTLLVPATGMIAGALMALGAAPQWQSDWASSGDGIALRVLAGALLAACLNGFSNGINQIYDLEVDRINKPHRMLPAGRLTIAQAWKISLAFLILALGLALLINWQCFLIVVAATLLTYIYSAPPLRTKGRALWANITIAIPRGTLLVVCGWSSVKSVLSPEPWLIGAVFGLYFLGAATTKDFSDIEGDRAGNCRTLPVIYGVRRTIWMITPFFVAPFLAILPGVWQGWFSGNSSILIGLGVVLPLWGAYIAYLLISTAEQLESLDQSQSENHPSWKHMYLLTLVAQFGFASAYLLAN